MRSAPSDDLGVLGAQVEALLVATPRPIPRDVIASALPPGTDLEVILADISAFWGGRGGELLDDREGLRIAPRRDTDEDRGRKPYPAAIDALSIVAFAHPVTIKEMSAIRGSPVRPSVLDNLGDLVTERRRRGTGEAKEYLPSPEFLRRFGLASSDDLPSSEEAVLLAAGLPRD